MNTENEFFNPKSDEYKDPSLGKEVPESEQEELGKYHEQILKEKRVIEINDVLRRMYSSRLNKEDLTAVERRYAEDMLRGVDDVEFRTEANKVWNHIFLKQDQYENRLEYLGGVIDHLRDLVIKVADPRATISEKANISRKVANKNFLNDINLKKLVKRKIEDSFRSDLR